MHLTAPLSSRFDPALVRDAERHGGVAWSQFNESFERFLETPWHRVNEGRRLPLGRRLLRLLAAFVTARNDALHDLPRKAAALARLPIRRDPDVVFFGAEAGAEALLVRALFGEGGRVTLIDDDPAAFERYEAAPAEERVRAPRGWPERELLLRRDRARIEYVREDFFAADPGAGFDVGIDWGLVEHFDEGGKMRLLQNFRRFLRPGGLEVSACPRDCFAVRTFYSLFAEELNFGHRELLTLEELRALFARGGFEVAAGVELAGSCVVAARPLEAGARPAAAVTGGAPPRPA
jgi:SAM-dependent methyltransferase